MAAARRRVFVEKVLKRLFPHDPHDQEKIASLPTTCETPPERVKCGPIPPLAGGGTGTPPGRRLYTVALPPEGYVPAPPELLSRTDSQSSDSQSSCSSDDAEDQDPPAQRKRRRIRKHKSKKKRQHPNSVHVEHAELEQQQSLSQELQPRHRDGPTISKSKRRKLRKKQQVERKRAAGSLQRASGVSFLYEPGEGSLEPGASCEGAGGGSSGAEGHREEGSEGKAEGILDFLKSTQEMYFYDGVSKDSDPAFLEATEELLKSLAACSLPPSDLLALHHLKTLLLLQDPGKLQRALQVFTEHCTMPPDHARVVSAFFNYWITHVLPEKNSQ